MTDKIIELCKEKIRAFRNYKSVTIKDYDDNSSLTLFDTELDDLITWYKEIKEQERPCDFGIQLYNRWFPNDAGEAAISAERIQHFATIEEAQEKLTHCNDVWQKGASIVEFPKK